MAGLIRYLLLANFSLLVMALFYKLVLSKETRFKANRFILITGIILSLVLPLFQFNWFPSGSFFILNIPGIIVSAKSGITHIDLAEIQIFGTAPFSFPWIRLIVTIYIAGVMFMGISLIWRIKKLQYWTRRFPMKWFRNLYITIIPGKWSPFSFFGIVYYPAPLKKSDKGATMILEHEKVHIRQKHSWDILFVEMVKVLFFYNPAIYTIKKQIQINHEYIADSKVVGEERKLYSQELIRNHLQVPQFQFIQQFKQTSFLKRRIIMLMKNKSKSFGILKYLLLLPLIGGLIWLSACTDEAEPTISPDHDLDPVEMEIKKQALIDEIPIDEEVFYIVEEMPEFEAGGLQEFRNWVQLNIRYPAIAMENGIKGTVYVDFVIGKTGNVTSIKILRGVDPSLDNEVTRVLKTAPDWTPGKQRGKQVNVKMSIPVKFMLQ